MWWIILKRENTDKARRENKELSDRLWLGEFEGVPQEFLQQIVGKPDWNSIRKCKCDKIAPLWIAKIPWQEIRTICALVHLAKAGMHKCSTRTCNDPASREQPSEAELTLRKYNSAEYWEPNLHRFMIWLRFYWSYLYTRAVPLTGAKSSRYVSKRTCLGWFINAQVHPINKGIRMHFSLDAQESASQAGVWLLGRQLCRVVWAEGLWKPRKGQDPSWGLNE